MKFDAVVIGGGKAGCEAATLLLDAGLKVCLVSAGLTMDVESTDPWVESRAVARKGAVVLRGDTAVSAGIEADRVHSVYTECLEDEPLEARLFILATGKYFSRGLLSDMERIYEPVFGADVDYIPGRENWYDSDFSAAQPFLGFGVKTDAQGRVLIGGKSIKNLYATGDILARGAQAASIEAIASEYAGK